MANYETLDIWIVLQNFHKKSFFVVWFKIDIIWYDLLLFTIFQWVLGWPCNGRVFTTLRSL